MEKFDEPRDVIALLHGANPSEWDGSRYAVDESQLAAARARVIQTIAVERGGHRTTAPRRPTRRSRTIRWAVIATAAAAAVSIALLALPERDHLAGLTLVNAAAKVAASQPPTLAPPGEYYRVLERRSENSTVATPVITLIDSEYWVAADGSGLEQETMDRPLSPGCGPPGPTPQGYLSATCAQHGKTVVSDFRFGPGRFDAVFGGGADVWVRSLPTGRRALEAALQAAWTAEWSDTPLAPVGAADSAQLFGLIGGALADPITSPSVRGGLFRLAATLPGASVQTGIKDHSGRSGTAITVTGSAGVPIAPGRPGSKSGVAQPHPARHAEPAQADRARLIFDPATSEVLDLDTTLAGAGGEATVSVAFLDQGIVRSLPITTRG